MVDRQMIVTALLWGALTIGSPARAAELTTFRPTLELAAPAIKDQDDGCLWIHPREPGQSTIIASDKSAGRLFVYDLDGRVLQDIALAKPGNIDIRQRVRFAGQSADLVAVNLRAGGFKLAVFRVDPESRQLERLDDAGCTTAPNYGGCLYTSAKTGRLFFVCTAESGAVEQYELKGDAEHKITTAKVRSLTIGKCEGAVADDESGELFIAEEKKGVWKFSAEPDGPTTGDLIVRVGEHGLQGDVEGLALFRPAGESRRRYLLVSDQGRNRFMAYRREAPHEFVAEFAIEGAVDTDGIDVSPANFGPRFPDGVFVCHTGRTPRALLATPCGPIAEFLRTADKVPPQVRDAFRVKFPGVNKVEWKIKEDQNYEAEFTQKKAEVAAKFDDEGKWLETETAIERSALTKEVQAAISKDFKGYKIIETQAVEFPGDKPMLFEVHLENAEEILKVQFKKTGEITSKSTKRNKAPKG